MARGWSGPEQALLRKMYVQGYTYEEIAASLSRTTDACRHKSSVLGLKRGDKSRVMVKPDKIGVAPDPYQAGWLQRIKGGRKASPHERGRDHWSWLAGWHDADMEQGVSYIDQLRANQA